MDIVCPLTSWVCLVANVYFMRTPPSKSTLPRLSNFILPELAEARNPEQLSHGLENLPVVETAAERVKLTKNEWVPRILATEIGFYTDIGWERAMLSFQS